MVGCHFVVQTTHFGNVHNCIHVLHRSETREHGKRPEVQTTVFGTIIKDTRPLYKNRAIAPTRAVEECLRVLSLWERV